MDGANVGLYGQNWDQSVNFHQVYYMNASGAGIATFYSIVSHIKYIAHVDAIKDADSSEGLRPSHATKL